MKEVPSGGFIYIGPERRQVEGTMFQRADGIYQRIRCDDGKTYSRHGKPMGQDAVLAEILKEVREIKARLPAAPAMIVSPQVSKPGHRLTCTRCEQSPVFCRCGAGIIYRWEKVDVPRGADPHNPEVEADYDRPN